MYSFYFYSKYLQTLPVLHINNIISTVHCKIRKLQNNCTYDQEMPLAQTTYPRAWGGVSNFWISILFIKINLLYYSFFFWGGGGGGGGGVK